MGLGQALRFDLWATGRLTASQAIASGGDINRDGFEDILVGAPVTQSDYKGASSALGQGRSGALHRARSVPRWRDERGWGWSVANAGDVNEDGFPTRGGSHLRRPRGRRLAVPGCSWAPTVPRATRSRGRSATGPCSILRAGGTDLNGDGVPDVIIGAPDDNSVGGAGGVFLFSGKDGSLIEAIFSDEFPYLIRVEPPALAGDWNQDGVTDRRRRAALLRPHAASVRVYRARTGTVLATLTGEFPGDVLRCHARQRR
ncbi:MAG: integrin alpha [Planctomycetota bacterium]